MDIELQLSELDLPDVPVVLSAWHASIGQRVVEGDRLIEVTAGDVTVDLSAPASGVLIERCAKIDERLKSGQLLARIRPESSRPAEHSPRL
jgi:pyruvate/2-oxoglutarate dehydrogenase complex dihydrolipoamide acyltransferase (E2) component